MVLDRIGSVKVGAGTRKRAESNPEVISRSVGGLIRNGRKNQGGDATTGPILTPLRDNERVSRCRARLAAWGTNMRPNFPTYSTPPMASAGLFIKEQGNRYLKSEPSGGGGAKNPPPARSLAGGAPPPRLTSTRRKVVAKKPPPPPPPG